MVFDHKGRSTKIPGDPSAIKIDLEGIPAGDRFNAINNVVVSGKIRFRGDEDKDDHEQKLHKHDTEVQLKLDYALAGDTYKRGHSLWTSHANEDSNHWEEHNEDQLYRKVFGGKEPDTIYLIMVNYGQGKKHQTL